MAHKPAASADNLLNKENIISRLAGKAATLKSAKVLPEKRGALGELGNKLTTIDNVDNNKTAATQAIIKKPITLVAAKADTAKIPKAVDSKKPPRKDETLQKAKHVEGEKTKDVKSYSSKQLCVVDPDEKSRGDPQMVTEYLPDIFNHLRELEDKYPIHQHFLDGHQSTPRMRAVLVNWLVDVHTNFKFYLETLHLCVAIIDRYLQENRNVGRSTLQLVGTSAMVIAGKYEEMYLPELRDFMEREILKRLDFNLGRPLSLHFLRRYNKLAQVRSDHHTLGKYVLELCLLEHDMSHVKPSIQAAAACCLSIGVLDEVMELSKIWTPTLARYSTYEYTDFRRVIVDMAHLIVKSETSKFQTIRKKYASHAYAKISLNSKLHGPLIRRLTVAPLPRK
ncbi:hypothetical protein NQ318_010012 [Aromia moschata]|uniref:Uncharacterized protein n=1 Tax=Aromia moschata TaxID=1265417 RepID=A0AAV8Y9Q2_9CUCU|nr:hypothetical protein NQ318_010012 [Aromia moschata]